MSRNNAKSTRTDVAMRLDYVQSNGSASAGFADITLSYVDALELCKFEKERAHDVDTLTQVENPVLDAIHAPWAAKFVGKLVPGAIWRIYRIKPYVKGVKCEDDMKMWHVMHASTYAEFIDNVISSLEFMISKYGFAS